ncbi:hypothetical protein CR513_04212, partial [Mucuna pruriens]
MCSFCNTINTLTLHIFTGITIVNVKGLIDWTEEVATRQSFILLKGKLVMPKQSPHIPKLIPEFHNSPFGDHSNFSKTFKRLSNVVYWEPVSRQCNKCETLSPAGLLQPLPITTRIWSDISMDFIGDLPKAKGLDTVLVEVDRLTK